MFQPKMLFANLIAAKRCVSLMSGFTVNVGSLILIARRRIGHQ